MRIAFDLRGTGLGNGGGSMTIVRSSNALKSLGHDVFIIDSMANRHTWTKLEVDHIIMKGSSSIPTCDVLISTGFKSVPYTISTSSKFVKIKMHYIRGYETWVLSEDKIVKNILSSSLIKVVNSVCLKDKLKSHGVDSHIIYPGNDIDDFHREDKIINDKLDGSKKEVLIIGGLYNLKHRRIKRMDWILQAFKHIQNMNKKVKKYKGVELWMMGNDECRNSMVTRYFRSPKIAAKNKFYNYVDIWLAPTMQEGLHICPQEAMLCECCVIGTNAELNGMRDYLVHKETGLVAKDDLNSFIRKCECVFKDDMLRNELGRNGRKIIIEMGDRRSNMNKFVDLMIMYLGK